MYQERYRTVSSMKRRFAILSMAACVALSGVVARVWMQSQDGHGENR